MSKIDLTSLEWREMIFQGKNKSYGAYALRSESAGRHNKAIVIVLIFTIIAFSIPRLVEFIKSVNPQKEEYGATVMTKLPPPEVKDNTIKKVESTEPPPALKSAVKLTVPNIKDDQDVKEENEMKSQDEVSKSKGIISIADVKGNDEVNGKDIGDVKENVIQVEKETIYEAVEQNAAFPGGEEVLLKYVHDHVRYPEIAMENDIHGKVILRFVVTKTGAVGEVQVLKSLDPSCDKEAQRVVRSLPNFIPGKQNGVNVSVWFTLPITFTLNK